MTSALCRAIAVSGVLALVGCSTHNTTAKPKGDLTPIYAISDSEALGIAHRALVESFPSRRVTNLEGPTWGFSTTYRMALDTYSQQILVLPMEGSAPDGSKVRGFAFDVSDSGSAVISGSAKNRGLFKRVTKLCEATGSRILVTDPTPVPFRPEKAGGADGESASVERRLRDLRDLRDTGLITPEQFAEKQKEILDDL